MSADIALCIARAMIAASFAILVVLALRGPMRRWFGARVAYGLWALVPAAALAMLIPARTIFLPMPEASAIAARAENARIVEAAREAAQNTASAAWTAPDLATILLFVWIAGALGAFLAVALDQRRVLANMRLRRDGALYRAEKSTGPAVVGVISPRIVVPADFEQRYSALEQELMLEHERAHIRSRDTQINALAALAQCINWFNPLFYIARSALRADQELACDEHVMRRFARARRAYAEAMLKTQLAAAPAIPLGCHWRPQGMGALKERIAMLAHPAPAPLTRAFGALACAAAVAVVGFAAWIAQPPQLVYAQTRPVSAADRALGSQLVDAAQERDSAYARQLIQSGADVNYFRRGDGTPLIMAIRNDDAALAQALISAGANVNLPAPGEGNALIVAARGGDAAMVDLLLNAGANVNAEVRGDETPLIAAAWAGRLDAVRTLLDRGADPNLAVDAPTIRGTERRSPLSMARRGGHGDVIALLTERGARS